MKLLKYPLILVLTLGAIVTTSVAQNATTNIALSAESTVQGPTNSATGFTNYVSGYDKIKYVAAPGNPAKTYMLFDFTGQNPNTNYALRFTFTGTNNNLYQHLQLWVLNQAYPAFTTTVPTLSWVTAQADDTNTADANYNSMLTNGTFSATQAADFIDAGGGVTYTFGASIQAPWTQYLISNKLVIVICATNDALNSANGARIKMATTTATFQPLTGGTQPPTISAIPAQTIYSGLSSANIPFTVSDPVDNAASLTNIVVTLGNTNVTLSITNITSGSGGSRTLKFTPVSNVGAGATATVTVTVTVTDVAGNSATSAFLLTVLPSTDYAHFLIGTNTLAGTNVDYLPPTNTYGLTPVSIPFLIVNTNTSSSASNTVLTVANSIFTTNLATPTFTRSTTAGATNTATLTVTPSGSGVGTVVLTLADTVNHLTNSTIIAVMVLPDNTYAIYDNMTYAPSTSYSSSSGHANFNTNTDNLWAARSTSGSVNMITTRTPADTGIIAGVPVIRGTASGNQNQIRLIGAPYAPGSHKVLFAQIQAIWADLSVYGASAAFPSNSTGGFIEFAADANATGTAMAAVCTVTNSDYTLASPGATGHFNLGIYNGTNAPSVFSGYSEAVPNAFGGADTFDPQTGNDLIDISYDVDTGISTLWVNQTSSTGTSVNLQDQPVTNLVNVSYFVLRQNAGMGDIVVQSARVKVVSKPFPTVTGISQLDATHVRISFASAAGSGGTCSVVAASTVDGTYNVIGSTINESPANSGNFTATVTVSGTQEYFRIKQSSAAPTVNFPF
jgi:hypothetical protein